MIFLQFEVTMYVLIPGQARSTSRISLDQALWILPALQARSRSAMKLYS
jgi:hypothetical protein